VVVSDGECNEGSVWEAALLAGAQQTSRLCVVVDFNRWQATGRSTEIMALDPLRAKWEAFGWDAREVDGHDLGALAEAMRDDRPDPGRPLAIVAHTVKGKGISFMEDDNNWHYRIPNAEEVEAARRELRVV
jgi:transketolase